jgi:hypothetical protein
MRIVQTLTTTPNGFGEPYIKGQLELFQCSIKMARRFHPITLYTDERGANELGHLVNEVKFLEKNTENYLWCEPKFEAMKKETGDFIHMDGDVFLAEPLIIPDEYDVLYDFNDGEIGDKYYANNIQVFDEWGIKEIFPHWSPIWDGAHNVGLLSFKNPEHMKMYMDTFYAIKEFYFKKSRETGNRLVLPELIMEQLSLRLLAKGEGWKDFGLGRMNSYIHMYSGRKFQWGFMQLIENMNKTLE